MRKLSIRDLDIEGKKVLIRVDYNVPLNEKGEITDDRRIRASLPTLEHVLSNKGSVVLMSHLGRPKGKVVESMSLKPAAARLQEILQKEVRFAPDCLGREVEELAAGMGRGDVLLLENLRFHPEEEANDPQFAESLSKLGDVYVNDAFGTAHRAHASTVGVTQHFKECAAGFLMKREIEFLSKALQNPAKPFVAILGGAKISGKIELIRNLLDKVDKLLIGGGMAFTFFKAQKLPVGASLVEEEKVELAKQLLREVAKRDTTLLLPIDCVVAREFKDGAPSKVVAKDEIPQEWMGLDMGPLSIKVFSEGIKGSKTILWNGPLGVFEFESFAKGTEEVGKAIGLETERGALSIIGGGDTAAAVEKFSLAKKVSHISTGGGASLEFLAGRELPGVAALTAI